MFDYLNKILYKTKGDIDLETLDENQEFQPFLIQRWCSMYSPQLSDLLNKTSNRIWPILDNKTTWFQYLNSVVPACRFKKINYIKKTKKTEAAAKNTENILKVAQNLEISSREVNLYIEQFNLQIPNEKK